MQNSAQCYTFLLVPFLLLFPTVVVLFIPAVDDATLPLLSKAVCIPKLFQGPFTIAGPVEVPFGAFKGAFLPM